MPHDLRPARCRVPQHLDLFNGAAPSAIGGLPVWSGLPTQTQAALTDLMTRLLLDHTAERPIGSIIKEDGHDL